MLDEIEELLLLHPDLEDLFDVLDVTVYEVIETLIKHGKVELPEYVRRNNTDYETEESEET